MPILMVKATEYKMIETETNGEVHIKVDSQYNNINADKITVNENVTARLFGTVSELLIVKKDSRIYFHGTIKGIVENEGGELFVYN